MILFTDDDHKNLASVKISANLAFLELQLAETWADESGHI